MHGSKPTVSREGEACRRRPWRQQLPTLMPSGWQSVPEAEKEGFATVSPDGDGVFHITKQMDRTSQDAVGENCVCNNAGELALTDEDKMKAWVEHYVRLFCVEFEWPSNELPGIPSTALWGPFNWSFQCVRYLIREAFSKMKCSKAAVPSGVVAEMLKSTAEEGVEFAKQLTEAVFSCRLGGEFYPEPL